MLPYRCEGIKTATTGQGGPSMITLTEKLIYCQWCVVGLQPGTVSKDLGIIMD